MKITNLSIFHFPIQFPIQQIGFNVILKISDKIAGSKKLTSAGGRKLRFYISLRYLKSAWR